jgi:hypothetical protein
MFSVLDTEEMKSDLFYEQTEDLSDWQVMGMLEYVKSEMAAYDNSSFGSEEHDS